MRYKLTQPKTSSSGPSSIFITIRNPSKPLRELQDAVLKCRDGLALSYTPIRKFRSLSKRASTAAVASPQKVS